MINYCCISVPWNRGFITEILQSVPLFSALHIQTGLVAAGFAYILKCLARAEALEDIFNLISLRKSCVTVFTRLVGCTAACRRKALWCKAEHRLHGWWCLCLTQIPLTSSKGWEPSFSQAHLYFSSNQWLISYCWEVKIVLLVNVWTLGFFFWLYREWLWRSLLFLCLLLFHPLWNAGNSSKCFAFSHTAV